MKKEVEQSACPKCRYVCKSDNKKWDSDGYVHIFKCSCGCRWQVKTYIMWDVPRAEVRQ